MADTFRIVTPESEARMERRRRQRWWEAFNRDPEVIALRRYLAATGMNGAIPFPVVCGRCCGCSAWRRGY